MNKCQKYPFNYSNHIHFKKLIGPSLKYYTKINDRTYKCSDIGTCDNCFKEGHIEISAPILFKHMEDDLVFCTFKRMGLKYIDYNTLNILPIISQYSDKMLCNDCIEELELQDTGYDNE